VEGAGPAVVAKAALQAAKAPGSKAVGHLFGRIRKPADREALYSWAGAAIAGYAQQASIHNAEPPIFDLVLKGMGIPRSTVPPPKVDVERLLSIQWSIETLSIVNDRELEQAGRDFKAIDQLIEALDEFTDWNVAGSELETQIEALTKSRSEPPSKRRRKASRQHPHAKPAIVDLFLRGFSDLDTRPYLLALFIGIRRSSLENSTALTQAIALAESLVSRLPQRTKHIREVGPVE
jgi:hypothetical protein